MLDERQDVLFDTKVNTSRFGIASADWPIPQNANSGHYTIEVGPDGLDSTFSHDVEIRRYEPWSKPERAKTLDFAVNCTPSTLAINQVSECDVSAGRSSFRGYGMLIANVGLPPGAEVDRGSLAALVEKRAIDSFEIAPDHVGIYLWPQAAGTHFKFGFRPRFAMHAKGAQSVLYDYYNPDERVVLQPLEFQVK